jgi:hypothetical protein
MLHYAHNYFVNSVLGLRHLERVSTWVDLQDRLNKEEYNVLSTSKLIIIEYIIALL